MPQTDQEAPWQTTTSCSWTAPAPLFRQAGEKSKYWQTRADDLAVKALAGLLERNPSLLLDRIDDVAVAATTQTGDPGRHPDGRRLGLATADEAPRPETTMEGLAGLKTPFRDHGPVTAGNASGLNDGTTMSILASASAAKELGLSTRMRMVSYAFAGVDPDIMGIGPVPSTERALRRAGLGIDDIGLFELNEAFAVQVLAFTDHFGLDDDGPRPRASGSGRAAPSSGRTRTASATGRATDGDPRRVPPPRWRRP